jgi:hypothetical protein
MSVPLDFPANPVLFQLWTAPTGTVYVWTGSMWAIGTYDSSSQQLLTMGELLGQVRTLLQDTDSSGSTGYRYSTDSIVTNLNQGMADLYRIRPDLFLEVGFAFPSFSVNDVNLPIGVEPQYMPPLIMYVVGLTQARDDEQTQDARAGVFLQTFKAAVLTVA